MNTELRKRLEEATEKYCGCSNCITRKEGDCFKEECLFHKAFIAGAEWGYKEAIALAKEWIRDRNRHACEEWLNKECTDFEADMNKLWEEKK